MFISATKNITIAGIDGILFRKYFFKYIDGKYFFKYIDGKYFSLNASMVLNVRNIYIYIPFTFILKKVDEINFIDETVVCFCLREYQRRSLEVAEAAT